MSMQDAGGTKEVNDNFTLYKPKDATTIAAIYAHGVEGEQIPPITGVTLGYYCEHGDTVMAQIDWARNQPTYTPDAGSGGQWESYVLSNVNLMGNVDELAKTADELKVAIAYVTSPTTTKDLVPKLSSMGYSEIRGVHCRESLGKSEPVEFAEATEVTHDSLVGWKELIGFETITADTALEQGDPISDTSGNNYSIDEVVEPKVKYKIKKLL